MASKGKRQKSIIFRLVVLAFAVYTIISLTSLQMQLSTSKNELSEVQTEIAQQQVQNQDLLTLLETGTEQDFIERAARDRLGYVYADEEVYTDVSGG